MNRNPNLSGLFAGGVLAALAVVALADVTSEASETAELILTHGKIKTPDGWAEALAVRKGVILAVGDAQTVDALRAPGTQVIDLGGDTVLPGLHDVHVHPVYGGVSERRCRIAQGSTLAATQAGVKACAQKAAAGAWVIGGQWDASALGRAPNRSTLDRAAPENPVFLEDTSGHSVWVNSKALAIAGISRQTQNPVGGIIERDSKGEPTGVMRESAVDLVKLHIPRPSVRELESALAWSLQTMLSYGITSFTEASVGFTAGSENELAAYAGLADAGVLKQRARLCLTWAPEPHAEAVIGTRNRYARARLSTDCVKIFLDGVPTDSHTAAMLEPYRDAVEGRTDEAARMGMLMVEQNVLNDAVARFDRMGLTVKFHAAGDAAVRAGLNAIETARKANGFSSQMHNVGHCTFVAPQDIARARAIGATFEVSPYLWDPSPINDDITKAVGPTLIKRVWPVREMIESGALVVPGSDWSVVPSVSPWIGIETLVTRENPGGSETSFGKDEAISVDQALQLFTGNAARQEGKGSEIGRLESGMLADLIVLDRNPYEIPPRQIHATAVKMTFINGEKVFDAVSPVSKAAVLRPAAEGGDGHWLMMVKTNSTDPQRETQFNDWYDRIDIPDVLEVPGYMRARRGVAAQEHQGEDGKYVALYDIDSAAIDKTLIEMLMATRKMEQRGRSTDLLKVTERVYFQRYAPAFEAPLGKGRGDQEFLYLVKFECCRDAGDESAFNDWYDDTYLPAALSAAGAMRATRYKLYRVLMTEPHEVPHYLTVFELKASSAEEGTQNLRQALARLSGRMDPRYAERDATLYLKIQDVTRAR